MFPQNVYSGVLPSDCGLIRAQGLTEVTRVGSGIWTQAVQREEAEQRDAVSVPRREAQGHCSVGSASRTRRHVCRLSPSVVLSQQPWQFRVFHASVRTSCHLNE